MRRNAAVALLVPLALVTLAPPGCASKAEKQKVTTPEKERGVASRRSANVPTVDFKTTDKQTQIKIRQSVRERVYGLRPCYNQALVKNPTLTGRVKISFIITPTGSVTSLSVRGDFDETMTSCLRKKLAAWKLSHPPAYIFYGPFSIRFVPGK